MPDGQLPGDDLRPGDRPDAGARADPGTRRPALVGRAGETAQLIGFARQASDGRGLAVIVEGDPGMGKSTMLAMLAAHCRGNGLRVCHGKADELQQRLPFAAIGACLGAWSARREPDVDALAGLLRGDAGVRLASVGAADRHFVVTEAISELLDRWCADDPVALLLDDLHWADESSLLALHRLGPMLDRCPLLIVVTVRPGPRSAALDGLLRSLVARGARSLRLGPLDQDAVGELVHHLLGARPGPRLMALIAGAGGNPMQVTEWITVLRRDRHLGVTGDQIDLVGSDDGSGTGVTGALMGTISQRLDVGSRDAREVLRVAALLGSGFDVGELSVVLGKPTIELWEVLTEAVDAGVLVDDGERLVFRHDLLRQALAAELPAALRAALQLQIGQALAASGALPERVAERLLAATTLDGRALDWLVEQSRPLTRRAPDLAIDLVHRALGVLRPGDPRAPLLRNHLAWALLYAGRAADAADAARAALAADREPAHVVSLHLLVALAHFYRGDVVAARAEAERALAVPQVTSAEEIRVRALIAGCDLFLGDLDAVTQVSDAMADRTHHPRVRAHGLALRSCVLLARRRVAAALDTITEAIALTGAVESWDHRQISPYLIQGVCLVELDRYAEAETALGEALRTSQQGADFLPLAWCRWVRADIRFLDGRWDEVLAEVGAGLQATDYVDVAQMLHGVDGVVALHRGRIPTLPTDDHTDRPGCWRHQWVTALAREAQGHPDEALTLLLAAWDQRLTAVTDQNLHLIWPDIARLALIVDRPASIGALPSETAAFAEDAPAASSRAVHLLVEGVVDADPGRIRSAAGWYAAAGRPLGEAYAWECAAILLARADRPADARPALDRALAGYDALGAVWDADRAVTYLAELGVRRRGRPRTRPRSGWDALTGTERRIAELVAGGRSNPDIAADLHLSPRTVQHHVSSVLAKLGLSSRVELVALAFQRDADNGGPGQR
ncbi:ATP-binding protein [Micromonospora echinofusca]|uniref:AAA family ATPase n=1 Tax=Micromonospora echinofusca TaxID=47858 RepID=A0ABS3VIX8_MICEH|nr:AAA family ATPase [Micromonospora echinofusca]MBO4204482.1 AAA family ATPase [Micromonospora echinofusca]